MSELGQTVSFRPYAADLAQIRQLAGKKRGERSNFLREVLRMGLDAYLRKEETKHHEVQA
jgi:hypothetical protein